MTDCEKVLRILKDGKPHMNFDIIDSLGGGFAVAARVWDLRKPDGKYKLNIKYGSPHEFGKIRQKQGEWWYQLVNSKPEPKQQNFLNPVHQQIIDNITLTPLTKEYMRSHSQDIKEILG